MSTDYERIERAIRWISVHAHRQPTLAEVAAGAGLSPAHFQRVFQRWAGVSPKRFIQHLTAAEARRLLRESTPVLDAAFAVGLSGPGRLHDLMVSVDAMTPGECARRGAGLVIRHGVHDSPFGRCLVATTERGVCALRFSSEPSAQAQIELLRTEWPDATLVPDCAATAATAEAIFESRGAGPASLLLKGTSFQLKVWEALLRIPESCTIAYADLAGRLGCPAATRAVAGAVAANPVGYLIPCHRVLRANGALGGYRWGVPRKAAMLVRERADSRSCPRHSEAWCEPV